MRLRLSALFIVFCTQLQPGSSTLCVVTKWSEWTECTGTCTYGLQIRNRDVLRPPFPEIDPSTGEQRVRSCPVLYETRECQPTECLSKERVESTTTATNNLFRDLPLIRSVTSDIANSPFEADKSLALNRQIPNKTPVIHQRLSPPLRKSIQARRPNCTLEMNVQCCRLVREQCPDGSTPIKYIRWFRLPGENLCRSYHYPYCGSTFEKLENPLINEGSCLQLCFNEYEKAILPSLRII